MEATTNVKRVTRLYRPMNGTATNDNEAQSTSVKRVAAYCRVSSAKDAQLHSVKAQIDHYRTLIVEKDEYEFAGVYADEGVSGTQTRTRAAFTRLMRDCRDGMIDLVLTKSVSRFGRNTEDMLNAIRELKSLGIDVYFETENIHSALAEGELLLTLISAVAQGESQNLSENVKWGLRRKYETGSARSVPCGKIYGYAKADGQLVTDEGQAAVVRRMYQAFLDGYSVTQIAGRLTADGILTDQGNMAWNPSSVLEILRNEKFKGDMLFQKTYNVNHITKKRAVNDGELAQYYVKNSHPAIVEKSIWECVQLEQERRKGYCEAHHIGKYHCSSKQHPLSARMVCQTCGRTFMVLSARRVEEAGRRYWRCSSFRGKMGQPIEGMTYTPKPMALWSKQPESRCAIYRAKRRKLPKPRPMLCTDAWIEAGLPERVFVETWNRMVEHPEAYAGQLRAVLENGNALERYRAAELLRRMRSGRKLECFDYELSLKVLDRIEVEPDGQLRIVFLAGIT